MGEIKIKDQLSPAEAEIRAELGKNMKLFSGIFKKIRSYYPE